jgi:hypothetical protein
LALPLAALYCTFVDPTTFATPVDAADAGVPTAVTPAVMTPATVTASAARMVIRIFLPW